MFKEINTMKRKVYRTPNQETYLQDCKIVDNLISIRLVKMSILKNFLRNFILKSKWQNDDNIQDCRADKKKFSFFLR